MLAENSHVPIIILIFIRLSYVDYVLVPVDAGFLVEVIRLGL